MAIDVINKINSRLRFLYRQNRFLNFPLRRLLYNIMIQHFFDYACNACYPNINKKLKMHLQASQNKCVRFCLKLNDISSIKSEDFEKINWLPIHERVPQCSLCSIYNFFTKNCPIFMRYVFLQKPMEFTRAHHTKSPILYWFLTFEKFKQDVKNFS